MDIIAAQGLLDDKSLLQLSTANNRIVARSTRHNAMKRQMQAQKAKIVLERQGGDHCLEECLQALARITHAYEALADDFVETLDRTVREQAVE